MRKLDFFILSFILLIAFIFRLYKINSPLADFHSWRQADTAAVARNFVKNGFDLLHPRFDDLSNVQSGIENPEGYRMVEFPIYNAIFAYLYQLFPFFSLEVWGRLITIFFSLIIIAVIYYLTLNESGRLAAIFASIVYSTMPYFVFFSRVILPETTALAFAFLSILFLYFSTNYLFIVLSSILFAISILTKPTTIFYLLPIAYIFYKKYRLQFYKKKSVCLYFLITIVPFILWRIYIQKYPEGIPVSDWLITSVNTPSGLKSIFFRPAFFRWIFLERINNLILGGYLTIFFILGLIPQTKKYLLHMIILSGIIFLFIFQGGNVQHEYYQTVIFPSLAIAIGLGTNIFLTINKKVLFNLLSYLITFVIFCFSFYFSYTRVVGYFQHTIELIPMAAIISSLTDPNDKIVTDRTGDTTLLYLANRRGAPAIFRDPDELKNLGYKYLVTASPKQISLMKNNFDIVFQNDNFTIFKL